MGDTITIVGGGLAGLTLGIGLRQRGVRVAVIEAGDYPRHRVCGEFISGLGQGSLKRLGLLDELKEIGMRQAATAAFYDGPDAIAKRPLPEPALCVSRFMLDAWLARKFVKLGGELCRGQRWTRQCVDGVVRATGRRVEARVDGWRLFGLKAYAGNVALEADLELHFVRSGYVGICQLPDGLVNVCGLFRSRVAVPDLAKHWRDWLRGRSDSILHARLANAQWVEDSFCSVAGISLKPQHAIRQDECCLGDALTMIPPVTGNGMSMAFEAAELAIEPLLKYSRGSLPWSETQSAIAALCDELFGQRLLWAARLQSSLFNPLSREISIFMAKRSEKFWRKIFERTR